MKEQEKEKLGRRDFLRAMGAGAGLAVTAAAPLRSLRSYSDATPCLPWYPTRVISWTPYAPVFADP